ncbi:protein spire homolog 2 isoform X4 [Gallus gallus]|uniref:protein spire homolog 2 isoform X4 n=1 Tax=Gallus gallus TaxID=9031 RepID=UPI001F0048A2|nr:protein spire homolog 2 isoform X4 [Gallus gallus]
MEPGGGVRGAGGGGGSRRTGGDGRTDARGDTAAHSDTRSAPAPTGTEPAPPSLGGHCGAAPTPTFALSAVPSVRAGGAAGQSPLCLWSVIRHGRVPAAMSSLRLMTELGPRLAPRGDSPAGSCVPLNGSECSGRARTLRRLQLPSEAAALLRVPTAGSEQGAAVWLCVLAAGCRDAPGIRAWGCIRALCCCSAWGLCVAPSTAMRMAWVPSVPAPAHGSAVAQGEPTGGVLHVPIPQHLPPRREQPAELPLLLTPAAEAQMVQSLGFAIYRALDWGLDENEERELSPQLEQLIDLMTNSDSEDSGCGTADEGYGGQEEEEEGGEGPLRAVRTFGQAMRCCAARLADPNEAQAHYQAVCRALFAETVELKAFLAKIRDAKEMLQKLKEDEEAEERPAAELGSLRNTDWARLWVQLMRELRHGVKLKKVQEKQFNPLPTEYQLTPFEMLMQDIRARNYKLRKVMVDGDIPPRVKKDAHELILDFIRSRPPLKQASERRLRPLPQKQRTLHEKILEEIKQERKLRPVETSYRGQKGYSSLPCIPHACSSHLTSNSCIDLSMPEASTAPARPRPRVLLKAPTLAEMEEMSISEEEDSPSTESASGLPMKRDRSFSEQDLAQFQSELAGGHAAPKVLESLDPEPRPRSGSVPASYHPVPYGSTPRTALGSVEERPEDGSSTTPSSSSKHLWLEFSHPVESLALTVEEMINVRRVLVKAEMEKFLQSKELYNSLKKGKVCCCCRAKFPLFSWPAACLFCKRSVCSSCSLKMKMPSKKLAHIPVYALGFESLPGSLLAKALPLRKRETFHSLPGPGWRRVEEEFPHIYAQGSVLRDVCSDCTGFVADVICSSRRSVAVLNAAPRRPAAPRSLRCSSWHE